MPTIHSGEFDFKTVPEGTPFQLIHGGAGPEDPKGSEAFASHEALLKVLNTPFGGFASSYPQVKRPTSSMAALCLQQASLLEAEPLFNAGFGAALQFDGIARVSASYMDNLSQKFSAIINLTSFAHPSFLAHYLQSQRFCVLDAMGAQSLFEDLNLIQQNLVVPHRLAQWEKKRSQGLDPQKQNCIVKNPILPGKIEGKSTIGSIVAEASGAIAVCTSTGGVGYEVVGRVGDTPTVAGNFCNAHTAISCTGYGEQILAEGFAVKVTTRVSDGKTLRDAVALSLAEAHQRNFDFACIAAHFNPQTKTLHWVAGSLAEFFVWGTNANNGKTFLKI
jgi:L-asparaginase